MYVNIKTLQQKQFKVPVEPSDTIAHLKTKIESINGNPVACQKLLFSGKALADDCLVEHCNFKESDFVVLMISKIRPASDALTRSAPASSFAFTPTIPRSALNPTPAISAPSLGDPALLASVVVPLKPSIQPPTITVAPYDTPAADTGSRTKYHWTESLIQPPTITVAPHDKPAADTGSRTKYHWTESLIRPRTKTVATYDKPAADTGSRTKYHWTESLIQPPTITVPPYDTPAADTGIRTKDHWTESAHQPKDQGEIHRLRSEHLEAEKAFIEAYDIHMRIGNAQGAADALAGLGEIYRAQSKYREAEKAFGEAHQVYSCIPSTLGIGNVLNGLGSIYYAQSKYLEAEKAFKEAHELHLRIGNDPGVANAVNGLEDSSRAQANHHSAERSFNGQDAVQLVSCGPNNHRGLDSSLSEINDNIGALITWISPSPISVNGHFCDVFQGIHKKVGKVALKRPRVGGSQYAEDVIRRFEREGNTWKTLKHPHVLEFLGTLKRDGHLYLVSPFIAKGTVAEYAARFPIIDRVKLLRETASALDYLHTRDVVHGDVKGTNILLSDDDSALLCDFSLTKQLPSRTSTAMKGAGSVRWMAPELWDEARKSFQTDVYAFGMTIAEVLTSDVPLPHRSNSVAFMLAITNNERPLMNPMSSPDGIPYDIAWRVAKACWPGNPSERISMSEAFRCLHTNSLPNS